VIGETCFGACDGQIWVDVQGGTAPYYYDNSQSNSFPIPSANQVQLVNDSIITDLCADNSPYPNPYSIFITDDNNCEGALAPGGTWEELIDSGIVVTVSLVVTSNYNGSDVSCYDYCDGSSSVNVSGGASPYTYLWDDPLLQTTQTAIGLCAGMYTCTVTEANGCSVNSSVTITEPTIISSIMSVTNVSCFGMCDGSASVSITGGTPPYIYSWSNGQTTPTITNLCAGTYICTVIDVNGCEITETIIVVEPSAIFASITVTPVSCFGANDGSILAIATGGSPTYQYSIDGGLTWSTSNIFTGLTAGTYWVDITDANGCIESQIVVITEPPALNITATVTHVSCFNMCDGFASVVVSGGYPPYNIFWSNGQTTSTITNLCAGLYTFTVTDANGCTLDQTVTITEPTALSISVDSTDETSALNDGSATATVLGGTPGYIYTWNTTPPQTTNPATNLAPGLYTVTVTDATGCTMSGTTSVNAYNTTSIININTTSKKLLKITDVLGRETKGKRNQPLFYIYDDGTVEKRIVIE
jgi:hypothetical protein